MSNIAILSFRFNSNMNVPCCLVLFALKDTVFRYVKHLDRPQNFSLVSMNSYTSTDIFIGLSGKPIFISASTLEGRESRFRTVFGKSLDATAIFWDLLQTGICERVYLVHPLWTLYVLK